MQKITAHLLNQTKFLEILQFASNVLSKIEAEGIRPITYGSLGYLAYTNDNSIEVSDVDFLVPEEQFNKLIHILKNSTDIKIETTNYHSLKLLKDDLKISFDAIEHYLQELPATFNEVLINGIQYRVVQKSVMAEVYRRGADTIPVKRSAYLSKLNSL